MKKLLQLNENGSSTQMDFLSIQTLFVFFKWLPWKWNLFSHRKTNRISPFQPTQDGKHKLTLLCLLSRRKDNSIKMELLVCRFTSPEHTCTHPLPEYQIINSNLGVQRKRVR